MDETGYKAWLKGRGVQPTSAVTRTSNLKVIEKNLSGLGVSHGDLDAAFDDDGLLSTVAALRGLIEDQKGGGTGYRLLMPQSENPANRLANLPKWVTQYAEFRKGGGDRDADRIRRYALDTFIDPARRRGDGSVAIRAGDVHNALRMSAAHANVCQALGGRKLRALANVSEPTVVGPENSSTTTFTYALSPLATEPDPLTAMATTDIPSPTNLILYGPPGTGKTYRTAEEALRLCRPGMRFETRDALMAEYDHLIASGQIEFVTFHQSYSYEEFVEALRPVTVEGGVGFTLEPEMGAFRRIAKRAETSKGASKAPFSLAGRNIYKMSIGEAANPDDAHLFEEALAEGYALLGFGEYDWTDQMFAKRDMIQVAWNDEEEKKGIELASPQSARVQCPHIFRNWIKDGDLVVVSKGNGTFRAIGEVTGPYEFSQRDGGGYAHRRKVQWLWSDRVGLPVSEIYERTFSQRTLYQLTTSDLNLPALERYITSQEPSGAPEQFVLIIDEINRANISKVFGELITLLEPDKRTTPDGGGLKVRLPYSRELFGAPANLHVIGTMNTADRSIALLDTALRRRFDFRELMPDPEVLQDASAGSGVNLVKLLTVLNERIEYLFDREHQIGHAYFIGCDSPDAVDVVMRHKVIPLLAEYFYEDWSKVAAVLGDGADAGKFLARTALKAPAGLDVEGDGDGEVRYRWSVLKKFAPDRYAAFQ